MLFVAKRSDKIHCVFTGQCENSQQVKIRVRASCAQELIESCAFVIQNKTQKRAKF